MGEDHPASSVVRTCAMSASACLSLIDVGKRLSVGVEHVVAVRGKLCGLPWGGKSAGLSQRELTDLVLQKGGCKSMRDAASATSAVTARIADGSCLSIWR